MGVRSCMSAKGGSVCSVKRAGRDGSGGLGGCSLLMCDGLITRYENTMGGMERVHVFLGVINHRETNLKSGFFGGVFFLMLG